MRGSPPPSRRDRTRAALRDAALARFVRDGFDATTVDMIAADAGVTVRTFYRYYATKDEVLFADYEERLDWFTRALAVRNHEPLVDAVMAAFEWFPDDPTLVKEVARVRAVEIDAERIEAHIRRVEAEFGRAIQSHLVARDRARGSAIDHLRVAVVGRAMAAAVFTALDTWMAERSEDLDELTRLTREALEIVEPITR